MENSNKEDINPNLQQGAVSGSINLSEEDKNVFKITGKQIDKSWETKEFYPPLEVIKQWQEKLS